MRSFLISICLFLSLVCSAQVQSNNDTSFFKKWITPKRAVIGGIILQQASSSIIEYYWWWHERGQPFNINNDGFWNNYSLGMDKLGHAYISYMATHSIYEAMNWAGFTEKTSFYTSLGVSFFWALSIEMGDAHTVWGFSNTDLAANMLGIGYAVLQQKVPVLNNFNFTFSYFPSRYFMNGDGQNWSLTSDYDGHCYWLNVNVSELIPKRSRIKWPSYFNVSIGYSTYSNVQDGILNRSRQLNAGFAFNLNHWRPENKGAKAIKNVIRYIQLPGPGVSIMNGNAKATPFLIH